MDVAFVIILSTLISGIITICNLVNRPNRHTASRVISLFEMPMKKGINFASLFLFDDRAQKI